MGTINTHVIASKIMNIDWNCGVYLPEDYNNEQAYDVLILLHGANGNHTNLRERFDIQPMLDKLLTNTLVFFVDGFNTFYLNGKGIKMESMIIEDLIPYIKDNYKTTDVLNLGGVSMGGYGALRLSLKHHDMFTKVFAVAPAAWETLEDENEISHWFLFEKDGSINQDFWLSNHPNQYIHKTRTRYYIETGKQDEVVAYHNVDRLVEALQKEASISYNLTELGDHSWEYFGEAVKRGLKYIGKNESLEI